MRISDWSSDVCSSDLLIEKGVVLRYPRQAERCEQVRIRPGERRAQIGGVIGAERLQLLAVARRRGQCREADIVIDRAVVEPILHVAERGHVLRPREPAIERLERRSEEHTSELQSLMRISY